LDNALPMARHFSWLKHLRPCLIGFEPGLMLRVWSATSWETPDISVGLNANRSQLHWRKSTSSLSYLGSKLAPIHTVLVESSMPICTTLASLSVLKMPGVGGIQGLSGVAAKRRLSSLSSAMATAAAASSRPRCSQSSGCHALALIVMTLAGLGILCLRYV
jgi:hypothetical protein